RKLDVGRCQDPPPSFRAMGVNRHPIKVYWWRTDCSHNSQQRENQDMRPFWLFIAAFGFAGATHADGFSYTHLDGGYIKTEIDSDVLGFDVDGDGFTLGGSVAATENFHVFAAFS